MDILANFAGFNSEENWNAVWIYNPQNGFSRKQGPSLMTKRYYHSCSTMRNGEKISIVVVGGQGGRDENYNYLSSVEIYDPIDNAWHPGKANSHPQKSY